MKALMLPAYKVTEEGRRLYEIVGKHYPDYEGIQAACEIIAQELEGEGTLDLAWVGMLIFEAGVMAGKRRERARRNDICNSEQARRGR